MTQSHDYVLQDLWEPKRLNSRGFGLVDFVIIGSVISILVFIVVTNIVAHTY